MPIGVAPLLGREQPAAAGGAAGGPPIKPVPRLEHSLVRQFSGIDKWFTGCFVARRFEMSFGLELQALAVMPRATGGYRL